MSDYLTIERKEEGNKTQGHMEAGVKYSLSCVSWVGTTFVRASVRLLLPQQTEST